MQDICKNYHYGNPFSIMANEKIIGRKGAMKRKIYDLINKSNGRTCDEIENMIAGKHQTVSARISELQRDGVIIAADKRATRSGCAAAVYVTIDKVAEQTELF